MNNNLTEIVSIIDRSGSMQSVKQDAIGGFNSFIEEQLKEDGDAQVTVVLFNHEYSKLYDGVPLTSDIELNDDNYAPSGTTALLDAIGRTIDDVGKRLSEMPESDRPGLVIVAILTDGLENASTDYDSTELNVMIEHQQNKYGWEFVFLAANQDAIATARSLSIKASNAVSFNATSDGTRGAYLYQSKMVSQLRSKKSGDAVWSTTENG